MKVFIIALSILATCSGQNNICNEVDDNSLLPSDESCSLYFKCIDRVAYLLSCPVNYYFDSITGRCDLSENVECDDVATTSVAPPSVDCSGVEDYEYLPSLITCSEYFQCINEVAYLISCPRGLYFSPDLRRCTYPDESNCVITPPPSPPPTPTLPGPTVSCDGVEDFEYLPSPITCSEYFQCINEVAYLISCPRGLYFSPDLRRCTYPDESNCVITPPPSPPPTPTMPGPTVSCDGVEDFEYLPSPITCSEYFQCINEVAYLISCPRGLYFSPDLRRCTYPDESNCVITPPPSPPPTPTMPGPTVSCDGVEDFEYLPSPITCSEYFQCINEVAYLISCPRGLYFSPDERRCTYPDESNCVITTTTPIATPPTASTPTPNPICEGVTNFEFLASPESCSNYLQCIDGNSFLLSCPRGLYFDEARQTCDIPENVVCMSTSPSPPAAVTSNPTCVGVEDFRFVRSPTLCNIYFLCISEVAFLLSCPRGLYFNEAIQTCDYPSNVDCVSNPPETTSTALPVIVTCQGVENFRFIEHPSSCAFYYQCIGSVPFIASCPVGRYFDESAQSCVDSESVDCGDRTRRPTTTTQAPIIDPQCRDVEEGRLVSNVNSCTTFYQCLNGRAVPRFCDDGLWFDEQLQRCDQPELVNCPVATTTTTMTSTIIIPTAPNLDVCYGKPDGYIGSEVYCEKFFFCVNEVGIQNLCQNGFWFDRVLLECRPMDEVDCSLQTMPTTTIATTTTDSSPAGLCRAADNNTYVRNGMACAEFFMCINEEPHGRVCQDGLWFNMNQQRCTPPGQTRCELDEIVCNGVEGETLIRAPASCHEFISCIQGRPFPERCFGDLFFDEETQQCEPRENVECGLDVPTEEPRGPCDGSPDFSLVESRETCSDYHVCYNNEIFVTVQCPGDQVFDFATQVCGDFDCFL